jgi:Rod binding domain-containing protein
MIDALTPTTPSPAATPAFARPGAPTLGEAAAEFAAIFTQTLLKEAWQARGFLSGGREAQAFYDQLSWEYSRILARRNDAGIAAMVVKAIAPAATATAAAAPSETKGRDR